MDKSKHKSGRKLEKNNAKEKGPQFFTDVKSLKESLKIKEILRTVKMNSSMRIKAPPGSKVMNSKDFNDNEDYFEESAPNELQDQVFFEKSPSATNLNVISSLTSDIEAGNSNDIQRNQSIESINNLSENSNEKEDGVDLNVHLENFTESELHSEEQNKLNTQTETDTDDPVSTANANTKIVDKISTKTLTTPRDRKLSLDQTFLSRRSGLSQSELDLHLIGKSPLERKSSFFRKKMDSFLKNTTEIFKRQTQSRKSQLIQRRGSMSISLQSLSDKSSYNNGHLNDNPLHNQQELRNSNTSLSTIARSSSIASSISMSHYEQLDTSSPINSRPVLFASQPLEGCSSNSVNNLNEALEHESFLKSRAISMSSGLDAPPGRPRRKASKSNRVTWLASEGLTNYFKRVIQDEKSREKICHSYQDFSSIPEHELYKSTTDSKGRRLSYQRAVSGEDPVLPSKQYETTQRKKNFIREQQTVNFELNRKLEEFAINGVPPLRGYDGAAITNRSLGLLLWVVYHNDQLLFHVNNLRVAAKEKHRQAVICELVQTEADYVFHLLKLVELFIAAAHALQDSGFLLDIDTERLFTNLPDVLSAGLYFWSTTFYRMVNDCLERCTPFKAVQMMHGFTYFKELFQPYEKYLYDQNKNLDYLRSISNNQDFATYLSWCYSYMDGQRLQLIDVMVKPMQRLTKYPLLLQRILECTEQDHERMILEIMIRNAKSFVQDINRIIRQRDELEKLDELENSIETYDIFFREEDMDKCFKMFSKLNLKTPMYNCSPDHSRSLVFEGDLRFRDSNKEVDVKIFLFTDVLLICKKISKGGNMPYKMIRPKFMVDRLHPYYRFKNNNKDLDLIVTVVIDELGSSHNCFTLLESPKEDKNQGHHRMGTLNMFANKLKEAKICYELAIWYTKYPVRDLTEIDLDVNTLLDIAANTTLHRIMPDDVTIEKKARERVATMMQGIMKRRCSEAPRFTHKFRASDLTHAVLAGDLYTLRNIRLSMQLPPVESTQNTQSSRLSKSTSGVSYNEPHPGPSRIYRPSTSIECVPVQVPEEDMGDLNEIKNMSGLIVQQPNLSGPLNTNTETQLQVPQESIMQLPVDQSELGTNSNQRTANHEPITQQPKFRSLNWDHPFKVVKPLKPLPLDEESIMEIPMTFSMPQSIRILPSLHRGVPTLNSLIVRTNELMASVRSEANATGGEQAQWPRRDQSSQRSQSDLTNQNDQCIQNNRITQSIQYPSTSSFQTNHGFQSGQSTSRQIRPPIRGAHARRATSASPCTLRIQPQCNNKFKHSQPDLTIEFANPCYPFSTDSQSTSDKLYQTHYERLERFRRPVGQQQQQRFLSPDDCNTSPTRMTLSYSDEYPPLDKLRRGRSQTNLLPEYVPSTSRYSRSGSTSPVPEPSPERRAKSASGSRSNRSNTTPTDTQGARNIQTPQETEALRGCDIPIITMTPPEATIPTNATVATNETALTGTMDSSDTAVLNNTIALIDTEAITIADISEDTHDIEALTEQEALKFVNTSKDTIYIKSQEMVKNTKDIKKSEISEDAEAPADADSPKTVKVPEDAEAPKDAEVPIDAEAPEKIKTLEDAAACEDLKDYKISQNSKGVEILKDDVNMEDDKNLVDRKLFNGSSASVENKRSDNAVVLKEANVATYTKGHDDTKDTKFPEEVQESEGAKFIKGAKNLKSADISQIHMESYEGSQQDDNQIPPGENGNQSNSSNIGSYDNDLIPQTTRRNMGIGENLEFFDEVAPGNQRDDDQED